MYPGVYNNHTNSRYIIKSNGKEMHKSAIFGLFLMASLLMGTSVNMNMFSSANAQGMGQYDNSYQQSYGNDPYGSSYDQSYGYDTQSS